MTTPAASYGPNWSPPNSDMFSHSQKPYAQQPCFPWTPMPYPPAQASLTHWMYSIVGGAVNVLHMALALANRLTLHQPPDAFQQFITQPFAAVPPFTAPSPAQFSTAHQHQSMPKAPTMPTPAIPKAFVPPNPVEGVKSEVRLLHPHPLPADHPRFTKPSAKPNTKSNSKPNSKSASPKAAPRPPPLVPDSTKPSWNDVSSRRGKTRPKSKLEVKPNTKPNPKLDTKIKPAATAVGSAHQQPPAKVGGKFEPLLYMNPPEDDSDDGHVAASSPVSPDSSVSIASTAPTNDARGSSGSGGSSTNSATISSVSAGGALTGTASNSKLSADAEPFIPDADDLPYNKPERVTPELQAKVKRIRAIRKAVTRFAPKPNWFLDNAVPSSALIVLVAAYDGVIPREKHNDVVIAGIERDMCGPSGSRARAQDRAEYFLASAVDITSESGIGADILQPRPQPDYVPPAHVSPPDEDTQISASRRGHNLWALIQQKPPSAIDKTNTRIQHPAHTDIVCPANFDIKRFQELSAAMSCFIGPRGTGTGPTPSYALSLIIASFDDNTLQPTNYHNNLLEKIVKRLYPKPAAGNALAIDFINTITTADCGTSRYESIWVDPSVQVSARPLVSSAAGVPWSSVDTSDDPKNLKNVIIRNVALKQHKPEQPPELKALPESQVKAQLIAPCFAADPNDRPTAFQLQRRIEELAAYYLTRNAVAGSLLPDEKHFVKSQYDHGLHNGAGDRDAGQGTTYSGPFIGNRRHGVGFEYNSVSKEKLCCRFENDRRIGPALLYDGKTKRRFRIDYDIHGVEIGRAELPGGRVCVFLQWRNPETDLPPKLQNFLAQRFELGEDWHHDGRFTRASVLDSLRSFFAEEKHQRQPQTAAAAAGAAAAAQAAADPVARHGAEWKDLPSALEEQLLVVWIGAGVDRGVGSWRMSNGPPVTYDDVKSCWLASAACHRGAHFSLLLDSCYSGAWVTRAANEKLSNTTIQASAASDVKSDDRHFTALWLYLMSRAGPVVSRQIAEDRRADFYSSKAAGHEHATLMIHVVSPN